MNLLFINFPTHFNHDISDLVRADFLFSSLSVPFFLSFCCSFSDSCCLLEVINLSVFRKSSCLVQASPLLASPKSDRGARVVVGLLQSDIFDPEAVRALFANERERHQGNEEDKIKKNSIVQSHIICSFLPLSTKPKSAKSPEKSKTESENVPRYLT